MQNVEIFTDNCLNETLDFFNRHCRYDPISLTRLREKIFDDPDYQQDLVLTSRDGSNLTGFAAGIVKQDTAYLKMSAFDEGTKGKEAFYSLLGKLEEKFRRAGLNRLVVYDVPGTYLTPGIDSRYERIIRFFEEKDFRHTDTFFEYHVDLTTLELDTEECAQELAGKNIQVSRAGYDQLEEVSQFVQSVKPVWLHQVISAYNSLPTSLHLALLKGRIIAFAAHNANNFGLGQVGPVYTESSHRNFGIGNTLLRCCLRDIREWKLPQAVLARFKNIEWINNSVVPKKTREFWRLEKIL